MAKKTILKWAIFLYSFLYIFSCTTVENMDNDYNIDLALVNQNNWSMSNDILYLINQYRAKEGKSVFVKDTLYATAYAVKHTKHMISTNNVSHDYFYYRSNGLKDKGAIKVSENVAYGYSSANSVVNAWLGSESHRKVIEEDYSNVGFGVLKSLSNNRYYFTMLFYK
ncbi:CAP domain-containing protein [Flavivirga sp. 57AJ16]|uniref:CAP domain-containing protein n=1 Tax=Flavivirga sp. 57AJ16 TaxID=3025307 RepID=UPI002366BF60|nr:CAP domain-containing protein [Flavivirga sp. 57AJ16]MDD7886250.1 CAP domain-containing protein [Flavivirga sp. 57AJ16]